MSRFSKVISLVLLLAALVSVFGIFAAFAADETAATDAPILIQAFNDKTPGFYASSRYTNSKHAYGSDVVAVEVDENGSPILGEDGKPTTLYKGSTYYPTIKKHTAENGASFLRIGYVNFPETANRVQYLNSPYISATTGGVVVEDDYYAEGAAEKSETPQKVDNSDFLIFDMDVSTTGLENMGFALQHIFRYMALNKSGVAAGTDAQNGRLVFKKMDTSDRFTIYYELNSTLTPITTFAAPEASFVNITVIIDTRDVKSGAYGYVYLDGNYCGKYMAMDKTATYMYAMRPILDCLNLDSVGNVNQYIDLANYTYKRCPDGYAGDLATNASKLGSTRYTLAEFSDMDYYDDNLPSSKVATITRDGQDKDVYTVADLDARLQAGDVVTLYADITSSIIVPTIKEGETAITFELNGHKMADPVEYDFDAIDWIVKNANGVVVNTGVQSVTTTDETTGESTTTYADNLMASLINSSDKYATSYRITLLKDVTVNTAGILLNSNISHRWDLAGHTLTYTSTSNHFYNLKNSGTYVSFRDGKLYTKITGKNVVFTNNVTARADFIGLEEMETYGGSIDMRGGLILFKDCKYVTTTSKASTIVSEKSGRGLTSATVIIDNSHLESGVCVAMSNVSSSGYYGSANNNLYIKNGSKIIGTSTSNKVTYDADNAAITMISRPETGTNEAGLANNNHNYIYIEDSLVSATGTLAAIASTTHCDVSYQDDAVITGITSYTLDVDVVIKNSEIKGKKLYLASNTWAPAGFNYTVDVDVDATSKLDVSDAFFYLRAKSAKANLNLADGAKSNTNKASILYGAAYEGGTATVTTPLDVYLAYATAETNDGYDFVVTSSATAYSYKLGANEAVAFYFKAGDAIDINRALPALAEATDLYYYTWEEANGAYTAKLNKNFTFGVNLTLREDININIFLPANINPAEIGLKVNGADVEFDVFENKNKIVIKNVDPTAADVVYTITGAVAGAYGDSAPVLGTISVLDYIAKAYNQDADLFQAVVNYLVAASTKANDVVDLPDGLAATEVAKPAYNGAKAPEVDDVITGVSMIVDDGFEWVIRTGATAVKATYTVNGKKLENVDVAVKDGKAVLAINAKDVLEDVTVTVGDKTVTFNYAWYAPAAAAEDASFATLLDAIYAYAYEAAN